MPSVIIREDLCHADKSTEPTAQGQEFNHAASSSKKVLLVSVAQANFIEKRGGELARNSFV